MRDSNLDLTSTDVAMRPGSPYAVEHGCTCPILDNGHGAGHLGGLPDKDGNPMFWINGDCPIHSSLNQQSKTEIPAQIQADMTLYELRQIREKG